MRFLIVDDSSVMRKVIERALHQSSLPVTEVLGAASGAEALRLLQADEEAGGKLDTIFTDIVMPGMDGLAFLEQRQLLKLAPDVPVIMVTTEGAKALVLRAIAAGAAGYICKPFTPDQVRASVTSLLPA